MSDANLSSLAYIPEVTLGVTPPAPDLTALRFTGEDLAANKDTVASQEIRSDRQVPFVSKVGLNPGGSFNFELSFSTFQDFLASALGNTVQVVDIDAVTVTFDSTLQTITGAANDFDDIRVGSLISISNAVTAGNDGLKRVIGKNADSSVLTMAAGSIVADDAADVIDIDGTSLVNGVLKPSFTFEKGLTNINGDVKYQTFLGMVVDTMSLNVESKQIVTGSFEFLGMTAPDGSDNSIDADGYTEPSADAVMNGTNNVGTIFVDGAAASERFKSLTLEIGNNLRGKDAMGTEGFFDIGTGTIDVTGNLMAYFLDNDLIDKIRNHTSIALEFSITDDNGNSIYVYLPEVKLNQGDPVIEAINTDVMVDTEFQAIRDPLTGITIAIDFVAAP